MPDQTTVAVRVAESTKEDWESAAESPEYDSLSHLIRLAVQKEITGDHASESAEASSERSEPGDTAEILSEVQSMRGEIESMEREINALKREQGPQYDLDNVLLEVLPVHPDGTGEEIESGNVDINEVGMPPATLADRIGGDRDEVSGALGRLWKNHRHVRSKSNDENIPYYWRVEQ